MPASSLPFRPQPLAQGGELPFLFILLPLPRSTAQRQTRQHNGGCQLTSEACAGKS